MLQDFWTVNGACNVLSALKIWESGRKPNCHTAHVGAAAGAAGVQSGGGLNAAAYINADSSSRCRLF